MKKVFTRSVKWGDEDRKLMFEPDTFSVSVQLEQRDNPVIISRCLLGTEARNQFSLDDSYQFASNEENGMLTISAYPVYSFLRKKHLEHYQALDIMQMYCGYQAEAKYIGCFQTAESIVEYLGYDPMEHTVDEFIGEYECLSAIVETIVGLQVFGQFGY